VLKCNKCSREIDDQDQFCPYCGNSLGQEQSQEEEKNNTEASKRENSSDVLEGVDTLEELDSLKEHNYKQPDNEKSVNETETNINGAEATQSVKMSFKQKIYSTFIKKDNQFKYLLIAVFLLMVSFIPNTLYIFFTGNAVPTVLTAVWNVIGFVGFTIMIMKAINGETRLIDLLNAREIINSGIVSIFIWIFILSIYSIFGIITASLSGLLAKLIMENTAGALALTGVFILLGFILEYFMITGVMLYYVSIKQKGSIFGIGNLYLRLFKMVLLKPIYMLLLTIALTVILIMGAYIQELSTLVISAIIPAAFLQVFIHYLVAALVNAYILYVVFNATKVIIHGKQEQLVAISTAKKGIPIFAVMVIVPIVAVIIMFNTFSTNPLKKVEAEIQSSVLKGDLLNETGIIQSAIREYDVAYSKLIATRGYLLSLKGLKSSDNNLIAQGREQINQALAIDPINSYIYLFNGNLDMLAESYSSALNNYKTGINNPDFSPECFMGAYRAAYKQKNKNDATQMFDWLVQNEIFSDFWVRLGSVSENKLDKYIDQLDDISVEVELKMMYKYNELATMGNHTQAVAKLEELRRKYPKSSELNYMLARIYAEYRVEANNYGKVLETTEAFLKNVDVNTDAELARQRDLFAASMYVTADNTKEAERLYKELYDKQNSDFEVAEKYIYMLITNGKIDTALEIINKVREQGHESLAMDFNHALALLNSGDFEDSLKRAENMTTYSQEYTEEYDRYLYVYALSYANAIKTETDIQYTNQIEENILYHYINAMNQWKRKNSAEANSYMKQVLELDARLGYAWYCSGINYYEQAIRENTGQFDKAIECYLKSISIVPNHVEAYFSLGHCYKKAERYKEALRAFRKVLDLLPYEDHRTDPYGMTVHAQGEVNNLLSMVAKEEK